jgi:cyanophycinase
MRLSFSAVVVLLVASPGWGQRSSGPARGALIVDGGGATALVTKKFMSLAGGKSARIVVIPTGASEVRVAPGKTILNPDWPRERPEWSRYEIELKEWLAVEQVTVLHTRDRSVADSESFVQPLKQANGVFLLPGNPGRYADAYLGTRTQRELERVLERGGVILGSSAGAIISGSLIVRGVPGSSLIVPGHERGFAFLKNVAIDPHLTQAKREDELVKVVGEHPEVLGVGIDEDAALLVERNQFTVIGAGRAAIYDNGEHNGARYYWLEPGDHFDLANWRKADP